GQAGFFDDRQEGIESLERVGREFALGCTAPQAQPCNDLIAGIAKQQLYLMSYPDGLHEFTHIYGMTVDASANIIGGNDRALGMRKFTGAKGVVATVGFPVWLDPACFAAQYHMRRRFQVGSDFVKATSCDRHQRARHLQDVLLEL